MRRATFTSWAAALLWIAGGAAAQDATGMIPGAAPSTLVGGSHATAFESYLEQPGRLLVERRRRLDPIALPGGASLRLEPVVAFEPAREQERMLGVRLRVDGAGLSGRDGLVYLDLHELEALLRGIELLPTLLATESAPPDGEVEMRHETLDGLVVSVTSSAGAARRVLRLDREDLQRELPADEAALTALATQLDACRRFLFQQ